MKPSLTLFGHTLVFCFFALASAQIPAGSSTARTIETEIEKTADQISKIIVESENHFDQGRKLLMEGKREKARQEFDEAVDTILLSGIDVRASIKLQTFYLDLIERIYREELPTSGIRSSVNASSDQNLQPQLGFKEQTFEPSPLDELSKIVLYTDEIPRSRSTCTADQVDGLEIRGIRLGMSVEQIKTRLPGLRFTPTTSFGYAFASWLLPKQSKTSSETVRSLEYVSVEFVDGRLTEVSFLYDSSIKWATATQFADRISEALKLPKTWTAYRSDEWYRIGQFHVLRCENIRILAGLALVNYQQRPVLYWTDLNANGILAARKQEALDRERRKEEERRRAFKPQELLE